MFISQGALCVCETVVLSKYSWYVCVWWHTPSGEVVMWSGWNAVEEAECVCIRVCVCMNLCDISMCVCLCVYVSVCACVCLLCPGGCILGQTVCQSWDWIDVVLISGSVMWLSTSYSGTLHMDPHWLMHSHIHTHYSQFTQAKEQMWIKWNMNRLVLPDTAGQFAQVCEKML